jgi:predicted ABC-type ATPase
VQDEDVRRRYRHSLANLPVAPGLAHQAEVYDNSGKQARLIFQTRRGEVAWVAASEPEWARSARLALTDLAAQTQTSPRPPESPPVPPR